jgi:hypothetical protein
MSEFDTRPTIETVLEHMTAGFDGVTKHLIAIDSRLASIEERLDKGEKRAERIDVKLDLFIEEVIEMKRAMRS